MSILISIYFVVTLPMTTNIGCIAFKIIILLLFVNWAILPFLFEYSLHYNGNLQYTQLNGFVILR